LYPSLDYQISIGSVEATKPEEKKGFLEKIFGGDKDKSDKKEEGEKEKEADNKEDKKEENK